jgi:hypothetical protein
MNISALLLSVVFVIASILIGVIPSRNKFLNEVNNTYTLPGKWFIVFIISAIVTEVAVQVLLYVQNNNEKTENSENKNAFQQQLTQDRKNDSIHFINERVRIIDSLTGGQEYFQAVSKQT